MRQKAKKNFLKTANLLIEQNKLEHVSFFYSGPDGRKCHFANNPAARQENPSPRQFIN